MILSVILDAAADVKIFDVCKVSSETGVQISWKVRGLFVFDLADVVQVKYIVLGIWRFNLESYALVLQAC